MFYEVVKVAGGYAVQNWAGEIEIAYKNKKFAEQYAFGATVQMIGGAEFENGRRDAAKAYLAERANRAPVVNNQMELF